MIDLTNQKKLRELEALCIQDHAPPCQAACPVHVDVRAMLAAGLLRAAEVLRAERLRDPARRPLLVIVTDGRATDGRATAGGAIAGGEADRAAALLAGTAAIVVDCEDGPVRLGLAGRLAARLGARLVPLGELGGVVRSHRRHEHRKAA